jgi:hypothetical protein
MAKLKESKVPKAQLSEQDQKDERTFIKWMVGITALLILAIYFVFRNAF